MNDLLLLFYKHDTKNSFARTLNKVLGPILQNHKTWQTRGQYF